MVNKNLTREAFFAGLITLILTLMFIALAFTGCATKKKINKSTTQTETESVTTVTTDHATTQSGLTQYSNQELRQVLEEKQVSFDSIASVTIHPDGLITAVGRNPRIHTQRASNQSSLTNIATDTTHTSSLSNSITEEAKQTITEQATIIDKKSRPAFLSFVIFLGIVGLLAFVVRLGLKKFTPFG